MEPQNSIGFLREPYEDPVWPAPEHQQNAEQRPQRGQQLGVERPHRPAPREFPGELEQADDLKAHLAMGQESVPQMACLGKWNQRLKPAVQFLMVVFIWVRLFFRLPFLVVLKGHEGKACFGAHILRRTHLGVCRPVVGICVSVSPHVPLQGAMTVNLVFQRRTRPE